MAINFTGSNLFTVLLLFAAGLIFIIKGGDWFVDAATWIAEAFGIPKFIVGATVVSFAPTLPEIFPFTPKVCSRPEGYIAVIRSSKKGCRMRISPLCPEKAKSPAPRILTRSRLADRRTGRAGGLWSSFHRKRPHKFSKQVSWLAARHVLRLLTCETCNGDLQPAPRLQ